VKGIGPALHHHVYYGPAVIAELGRETVILNLELLQALD